MPTRIPVSLRSDDRIRLEIIRYQLAFDTNFRTLHGRRVSSDKFGTGRPSDVIGAPLLPQSKPALSKVDMHDGPAQNEQVSLCRISCKPANNGPDETGADNTANLSDHHDDSSRNGYAYLPAKKGASPCEAPRAFRPTCVSNSSSARNNNLAQFTFSRSHKMRKAPAATIVGNNAPSSRSSARIAPSSNPSRRIAAPAGFGALAMIVSPPPVTAPATRATWN